MEIMIKAGDRVKFLNDTGGGVVTEIKDSKIAMVLIDDDFEVPVLISELIPVTGSYGYGEEADKKLFPTGRQLADEDETNHKKNFHIHEHENNSHAPPDDRNKILTDKKLRFREEYLPEAGSGEGEDTYYDSDNDPDNIPSGEKPARHKAQRNLLLGLVKSQSDEGMEAWLINDSRFNVLYSVLQKDEPSWLNIRTGHIEPDTKLVIRHFSRDQLNSFITLRLQALFFMKGMFDPAPPSQTEFSLDPVEIFSESALSVNDFFDENAMIVPLISDAHEREMLRMKEQEVSRLIEGRKDESPSASGSGHKRAERSGTDPLVEEVDLHIEELLESHSGLSGREVLDIQMARFTTVLEGALRGKTKRVVFIHGIGNGKLKFEIRKTLDKKYPRLKYQDASFKEYGYGATMVIIRK